MSEPVQAHEEERAELEVILAGAGGRLLEFSASWCTVTRLLHTVEPDPVAVTVIDCDRHPGLAERFRIDVLPTFIAVADGRELARRSGATSWEDLRELAAQLPRV